MAASRFYKFADAGEHRGKAWVVTVDPVVNPQPMPLWTRSSRPFTKNDELQLYKTLNDYGYMVKLTTCANKDNLSKLLTDEVGKYEYDDFDSVMLVISGYGTEDTIYCNGGHIPLKEFIQNLLKADKCPSLAGKPKIIVLQLCDLATYPLQGEEVSDSMETGSEPASGPSTVTIPVEADFFFSVSNIPGRLPGRKFENGSLFVEKFCKILGECPSLEINKIFTRVRMLIDTEMGKNTETEKVYAKSQRKLPFGEGTLTKQFQLIKAK